MTDKTDKKEDKKEDKKKAVAHARSPTVTALETVLTKHFPPELVKIVFDYAREFEGLCVAQLGSGVKGTGNNELHHPLGISSDGRHLFVTDSDNYRVQVFDRNTLAFVRTFGKYGDGDSEFNHPSRAAFLSGEVFISDFFNMRIQVFTTEGKFKRAITMNYNPSTIAAAVGKIYVANYNQSHVTVYSLDGDQLERWTTKLSGPCGLGCDAAERKIYCVDRTCCRVFNEEGTELKAFGEKILTNPASVCVDAKHVYVADQMAVKVFKKPGYELVQTIEVAGEKQGSLPALLMTEDSTLFAVDELNQRVQIFQ